MSDPREGVAHFLFEDALESCPSQHTTPLPQKSEPILHRAAGGLVRAPVPPPVGGSLSVCLPCLYAIVIPPVVPFLKRPFEFAVYFTTPGLQSQDTAA